MRHGLTCPCIYCRGVTTTMVVERWSFRRAVVSMWRRVFSFLRSAT